MRVILKDSVAIAVDFQEKLMPVVQDANQITNNAIILLSGLKELGVPLYLTQQYTRGLGQTVQPILEVVQDNTKESPTPIEKISFSAYQVIQEFIEGKRYVIICGVEAHICVLQTVIDLVAAGYIPVLVADCISSRKELDKQIAMERAKQEGAIITTYEAILFELLREAGTERSKRIQKLIK